MMLPSLVPLFAPALLLAAAQPIAESPVSDAQGQATDKDFRIVAEVPALKAGADVQFAIKFMALNGFHISDEAPISAALEAADGVTLATKKLTRKDLVDAKAKEPVLMTKLHADKAGKHTVKSDVVFFLCTEKLCQRMTAKVETLVAVAP